MLFNCFKNIVNYEVLVMEYCNVSFVFWRYGWDGIGMDWIWDMINKALDESVNLNELSEFN